MWVNTSCVFEPTSCLNSFKYSITKWVLVFVIYIYMHYPNFENHFFCQITCLYLKYFSYCNIPQILLMRIKLSKHAMREWFNETNISTKSSTDFKCKLRCHWLKVFPLHHISHSNPSNHQYPIELFHRNSITSAWKSSNPASHKTGKVRTLHSLVPGRCSYNSQCQIYHFHAHNSVINVILSICYEIIPVWMPWDLITD